jgi:transforming growth factor-beta-induced protein
VAKGKLTAEDVANMSNITTLEGQKLPVNVTDQGVFVGNAMITMADINASNGVIHVIDAVLIPPKKEETAKWYFFSIPFKAENNSVENLLSGIKYNAIVYYNSSTGTFENASTIEPLKGYWIKVAGGVEFNASKQFSSAAKAQSAASVPPSLKLYPGWNAVGSPFNQIVTAKVAFASIDSYYSEVLGPWVPDAGNYQYTGHNELNGTISNNQLGTDVFEVRPFEGYWVFVKQETLYA